jgi:hypothetical protein
MKHAMRQALFHYRPSYAVVFLIIVGLALTRSSAFMATLLVLGYIFFNVLDYIFKRKAIENLFDEETDWKHDKTNPEYENRGNLTRVKLTGANAIIVTRIGEMLRRMPR